ncbi:putative transcription factor bHLH family [Arabidopsis thaliana]
MRGTTDEEDGVMNFSDVLMMSDDVLSSGEVEEDSFGFRFTGNDAPQMLCFGGGNQNDTDLLFSQPSFSPASPLSSRNNACVVNDQSFRSNKKTGSADGHDRVCDPKPGKRCKRDQKKSSLGNAKVKKEKVGEKITTLQHLVSPYGKTDAASVLHETMGYIKFLQDQVQVLSTPYFKHNPLVSHPSSFCIILFHFFVTLFSWYPLFCYTLCLYQ